MYKKLQKYKSFIMNCDAIVFLEATVMVYFPRLVVVKSLYFELLLLS